MSKKSARPQSEKPRIRAGLYVRVSTDAQAEEGYSIEAQKEMLEAYCRAKEIADYAFYIDGGFTGSNLNRPALARLIADIAAGRIDLVVVYKLDRLSRSQRDTLYLIEDVLNAHGAAFASLKESLDTSTSMGRAVIGILSAFAQLERETIFERTRLGMRERVKGGLWPGGGRPPFGYDYDEGTGTLVPNADAPTVRRIFELAADGQSPDTIARFTGMRYDMTVRNILHRKTYLGLVPYLGDLYPGKHPPLISEALYDAAEAALLRRTGSRARARTPYLLSGLLYCGVCGAKMRYQKWGKAGVKVYCYSQQRSKRYLIVDPACDNPREDAAALEALVLRMLFSHGVEAAGDGDVPAADEGALLRAQRAQAERRLKRLYALYADGDDALLAVIETQRGHLHALERQIAVQEKAERTGADSSAQRARLTALGDMWPHMTPEERRQAVLACIRRVTVTRGVVDIDFRF